MSAPLQAILGAREPLTLSSVPTGFLPWLAADLARAAYGTGNGRRLVIVAADEAAMRALTDTIPAFAPEVEVIGFPAWDCLPYDRASPALRVMAERMATLHALQQPHKGPQVLVTTVNAATQRVLTPFRIRQFTRQLKEGVAIERDQLAALLQANGYQRSDSVHDAGEYAVRGSIVDLYPGGRGAGDPARFLRRRDRDDAPLRSRRPEIDRQGGGVHLDAGERGPARRRQHQALPRSYREKFGANATSDPLYQAISDGRRLAGMEHWLPLFEEKLATLFDHLGDHDVVLRDSGADGALASRAEAIEDYFANRTRAMVSDPGSYRPLPPSRCT